MQVAEQLINPFGEDDDDFEINWVIDRNLQVSLIVADDMFNAYPQPEKDVYFDESAPDNLPYTKSTVDSITRPHMGSTADLRYVIMYGLLVQYPKICNMFKSFYLLYYPFCVPHLLPPVLSVTPPQSATLMI